MNAIGQREQFVRSQAIPVQSSAPTSWAYDPLGQVTSADATDTSANRSYPYDSIRNAPGNSDNYADFRNRFSTKPMDAITGLYYYGYRWYDPLTGRWPSRDPIGESGGVNLYGFVGNMSVRLIDRLGRDLFNPDDLNESKWQDDEDIKALDDRTGVLSPTEWSYSVFNEGQKEGDEATSREVAEGFGGDFSEVLSLWDIISAIRKDQSPKCCLKTLRIVRHGVGDGNGGIAFYPKNLKKIQQNDVRKARQRKTGKKLGDLLKPAMCKDCRIILTGCWTGQGTADFVSGLREGSKCDVVASSEKTSCTHTPAKAEYYNNCFFVKSGGCFDGKI